MSYALNYMIFDTNKRQIIKATIVSVKHKWYKTQVGVALSAFKAIIKLYKKMEKKR
jgi:hypothetical protein